MENLIVARAASGEIRKLKLELSGMQLDLSSYEFQNDICDALQKSLPQISVQTKKALPVWRETFSTGVTTLLCIAALGAPDYFFPDVRWLANAGLPAIFLVGGLWYLLSPNVTDGSYKKRRIGWGYLAVPTFYVLSLIFGYF